MLSVSSPLASAAERGATKSRLRTTLLPRTSSQVVKPGRRVNNSAAAGKLQGGEEDCVKGALERGLAGRERGVRLAPWSAVMLASRLASGAATKASVARPKQGICYLGVYLQRRVQPVHRGEQGGSALASALPRRAAPRAAVVRNIGLYTPNYFGFLVPKPCKTAKFFNQLNVFPMSPVFVTTPFLVQKALKTANSAKRVFSCQTSNVVPEPPSSLVFRRKPAPDVRRAPNSVFCPEKPANSSPLNSSPLVTALSPLAFWVQKCVKSGPVPELLLRRVFRGPSARRGPGSESDSPPRWSVSPPSLSPLMSPLMSPLHPAPVFGAKSAQNGRVRRVRFCVGLQVGCPSLQVRRFFGRKPAPDVSFPLSGRKSGEFQPAEHVTACHRFVTAVRQPAELVTTDVTTDVTAPSGSVFGAKSAQNVRVRRVRFSCRTASGMPEPPNPQVFGRKRAPDVSFPLSGRNSGEFQPAEHVTACHRLSPLRHRSLWGRKVRKRLGKARPAPRLRWVCKSWLILPVVICLSQSRS